MPAYRPGIRDKLIAIFILIKVIPLIVLAWFAWTEISGLFVELEEQVSQMAQASRQTTEQVSTTATSSSIRALDLKAREAIERLTTDTARAVARFLYDRDDDIRLAALLSPGETIYEQFLSTRRRPVTVHGPWVINEAEDAWVPAEKKPVAPQTIKARNPDNQLDFHYRSPDRHLFADVRPLFLEMTFIDLDGMEQIKVTTSDLMDPDRRDVSKKGNTFCKAETYFKSLSSLEPGQIYVSEVIGAYVPTHLIGPYTPVKAQNQGIDFNPEESAYAGKENPAGRRFRGLVRWGMPVVRDSQIIGYVTLALDHTHIMEFTDHIVPTKQRYTDISDAASGNYAFMWDDKGRNISHPRDYFITGYDPATGEPVIPWLDANLYEQYVRSGLTVADFLERVPVYEDQALDVPPSTELRKKGFVGLDCRYLNFAPQCDGWRNITQEGGSGSFVIFWSGLKKLTTAGVIPYFTGRYGESRRGFGFVTIGANVNEFHRAADITAREIKDIEAQYVSTIDHQQRRNKDQLMTSLKDTATRLTFYTGIMVIVVVMIAVFMAATLTRRITRVIKGVNRFQAGDMDYRLKIDTSDEMGQLGKAINSMADSMQRHIDELNASRLKIEVSNKSLKNQIKGRIKVQKQLQDHKSRLEGIVQERTAELEKEIVERKEKEAAVQDLKNMLSRIIDAMPSMMIVVDTGACITLWNEDARAFADMPLDKARNRLVWDVFPFFSDKDDDKKAATSSTAVAAS